MARKVAIFRSTTGLNNVVDPARLGLDLKTGECELAAAYNVDIDQTGRISRRRGLTQKRSDASHSGFCEGGDCLYVSGGSLYRLNPDYSREELRSDLTLNMPMSYVQVAGRVYYSNGVQKGYVPRGGADTAWDAAAYQGPETRKIYRDPPTGHLLAFFDSCILVAKEGAIYRSERFQYGWFRRYGFVEAERITMMQPVEGGLFVATANKTFFYEGTNIEQMRRTEIAPFGVIEGTVAKCLGERLGLDAQEVFLWATPKGLCVGGPGGFFKNLTKHNLVYPSANRGCGVVRDNTYLVFLQE